jgi:hypothetical protein
MGRIKLNNTIKLKNTENIDESVIKNKKNKEEKNKDKNKDKIKIKIKNKDKDKIKIKIKKIRQNKNIIFAETEQLAKNDDSYVLEKVIINGQPYYRDKNKCILNSNTEIIGLYDYDNNNEYKYYIFKDDNEKINKMKIQTNNLKLDKII